MRIYSATDVGQKRKMNQDYVFATADPVGNLPNLFVVADGMGGHNAGDYASSHAVTSMVEEIRQDADFNPVKVIRHAIETANTEILERSRREEHLRGMGTTIVVCTVVGHYAYVANVGDSRLYVIQGEIHQVTKDHSLVQEMIHFRNGLQPSEELDPCKVSEFEERYRKILETARKEYENVPANDYYRDGYNLFLRIEKYMQNHLLFLHDLRVPATNNEAERLLRNYKRKQAQAVTFRSFESIDYLCQCMSMLVLMRLEEPTNIFDRVSRIFG